MDDFAAPDLVPQLSRKRPRLDEQILTQDDAPVAQIPGVIIAPSSDTGSAAASARSLPDKVPVIELSQVRRRPDNQGYDVDMKLRNFSVKNSGQYTIFQNIDRAIIGDDQQGNIEDFSEAWKLGNKPPTDSFYVEPDWYSSGQATYSVTADIWIEKDAGSLSEQGYEKGEPGKKPWGNTPGREEQREIPDGTVFIRRQGKLNYKDGALDSYSEERTLYRMEDSPREITEQEAFELAIEPTRRRRAGDREYNKRMRPR